MISIGIKELLDAGVHFGHQTRRWNPKMKKFIFDARNGIHIIDLSKTLAQLEAACEFIHTRVAGGGLVLFVGTKKQAQEAVKESAKACNQLYVTERWLGGTLTNFNTIKRSIARLKQIEKWKPTAASTTTANRSNPCIAAKPPASSRTSTASAPWKNTPPRCLSLTSSASTTPSPKAAASRSPSSPSSTPIAIPTSSIIPSPATTTPSVPSASSCKPSSRPPPRPAPNLKPSTAAAKPSRPPPRLPLTLPPKPSRPNPPSPSPPAPVAPAPVAVPA